MECGALWHQILLLWACRLFDMAASFVGRGLAFVAAVVPRGVITPDKLAAIFRLRDESGRVIQTESGDRIRSEQNG